MPTKLPCGWSNFAYPNGLLIVHETIKDTTYAYGLVFSKCPLNYQTIVSPGSIPYTFQPEDSKAERQARRKSEHDRKNGLYQVQDASWSSLIPSFSSSLELAFVNNLCNTTRYYSRNELPGYTEYSHVFLAGAGHLPGVEDTDLITNRIKKFVVERGIPTHVHTPPTRISEILEVYNQQLPVMMLHCTHGVNRTGYIALAALNDLEISTDTLLDYFYLARGHDMNKQVLIDHFNKTRNQLSTCKVKISACRDSPMNIIQVWQSPGFVEQNNKKHPA